MNQLRNFINSGASGDEGKLIWFSSQNIQGQCHDQTKYGCMFGCWAVPRPCSGIWV